MMDDKTNQKTVPIACSYCGNPLRRSPAFVRRNRTGKWFCNYHCRGAFQNTKVPEKCSVCGKTVPRQAHHAKRKRTRTFCSSGCRRTKKEKRCKTCGKPVRRPQRLTTAFCSRKCAKVLLFQKGHKPWNKDNKGIHLSPGSEFRPGHNRTERAPVGAVSTRTSRKTGESRAWVKVADPNHWKTRARLVWEETNGPIPKGMLIHHENRNTLDDRIDNLRCLTRSEHMNEHRDDLSRWMYIA